MRKLEYLNTIEGQLHEYNSRWIKANCLKFHGEPYSKNALKRRTSQKQIFRQSIKEQLKKKERRCHRSELALEIDFQTTQPDPPSIQSLVKNYLDLLHQENSDVDNFKSILFKDDSQIKYLNARIHHNLSGKSKPCVRIKSYNFNYLIKDLKLVGRIYYDNIDDFNLIYEENERNKFDNDLGSCVNDLKDLEEAKDFYLKTLGVQTYENLKFSYLYQLQEKYLNLNNLYLADYISILQPLINKLIKSSKDESINRLFDAASKMILLSFKFIQVEKYPSYDGDSNFIKEQLLSELENFKKKHKLLFPLIHPIKLIIIYAQPKEVARQIDPDNLVRKHIIPLIIDVFRPPTTVKGWNEGQRLPKYSISAYEVIQIPRDSLTPDDGRISILITNGLVYSSLWRKVDDVIQKFQEKL